MSKEKERMKCWSIFVKVFLAIAIFFCCSKDAYAAVEQLYWPVPTVPTWGTYVQDNGKPHTGIDIKCGRGSEVRAAKGGTVVKICNTCPHDNDEQKKCCNYGVGNGLFIDHGDGTVAEYAHMKRNSFVVKEGDVVEKGQLLGLSASTGNSSGPHLHFGIRKGKLAGRPYSDFWKFPLIDVSPCGGEVTYENVTFAQPEFINISVSNITDKTALVKADIINIVPKYYSRVGVKWGTSEVLTEEDGFAVGDILNYVSLAFDGSEGPTLSPGTTYYYKFYLKNIYGKETLESPIYSFTTSGEKVPEVVTKISYDSVYVKSVTDTTASIRAEVTAKAGMYKEAGVYWGTTSDVTKKVSFDTSKNSQLTFIDVAFDGSEGPVLSPGTTYYYKFYAVRNDGTVDADTQVRSFTTNGGTTGKISYDNVYVKALTDTTASVRAEVTADASMYKEAGVYWGTTGETTEKVGFDTSKNSKLTFIEVAFDGSEGPVLSRGTTYYYRFYAVRNDGTVDLDYTVRSFTTTGDSTPPQINSAYVQDVNGEGYTVICTVADDVGVSRVCCPTWTDENGQDDLFADWYNTAVATKIAENTYMYRVNTSEHNNEWGKYVTHVYCFDDSGNNVNVEVTQSVYLVDHNITSEFPLINNGIYKIKSVGSGKVIDVPSGSSDNSVVLHQWENCAAESQKWRAVQWGDGYAFISVNSGKAMTIPDNSPYSTTRLTQYDYDIAQAQIFKLIHRGDGKYSIHPVCSDMALDVNGGTSDNGAVIMQYFYFGSDNQLWTFEIIDTEKPVISDVVVDNITTKGFDVTFEVWDNVGIANVCCPTWTEANGQDDLADDWYNTTKATHVSDSTYTYRVNVAEHNNESGRYFLDIYAYDNSGNYSIVNCVENVPSPVTAIALDKTTLNMVTGETATLKAIISPSDLGAQLLNWKSDNTSVVKMGDMGEVIAVGPGKATVTVTTLDGSNLSASCVVTVVDKLSIDTQPTSASVNEGAEAVFKVAASGTNVTYQWQFKSPSATYWTDSTMSGAKTNSIAVKASSARNGYQYRCVVKDLNGNKVTSNAATLTVKQVQGVKITGQPASATVSEGANATFKVTATGSNLTYQWQFKNASATYWTDSTMTGAKTNSITVKATTARNGYQYRCVVKDGSGNKVTSNAAKLTVNNAISITGQPASASVNEGANATFKVTASGSNLTYQWQFKSATATYWSNSTMTGSKTNSITVQGTAARNGYQYRCVVKDGSGNKVTSNAATLTVKTAISISTQPTNANVNEGMNVVYRVVASGSNLSYQWQFKKAGTTYWTDSTMTGSKTNSITVQATTARNGYQYRCVVKDGNGNKVTSNAATLTVVQNPGVKITGQPASQTVTAGNSATFKVTASGSGLTYQWQFRNATSDYWSNSGMAGSNTNSITVKGTTARNGYQYRCVVKDSNGNKVTSNAAKLTVQ